MFNHFAALWGDAIWSYERCRTLGIPLMSGSSLPTPGKPWLEPPLGTPMAEAVVVGYADLDSFAPHALNAYGCMVERREGGESASAPRAGGRRSGLAGPGRVVAALGGRRPRVGGGWDGWRRRSRLEAKPEGPLWGTAQCARPILLTMEYVDGMRGAMLLLEGYVGAISVAFRERGGNVSACEFFVRGPLSLEDEVGGGCEPSTGSCWTGYAHGSGQLLAIEDMVISGRPTEPPERCLLATGLADAAFDSLERGGAAIATPWLEKVSYKMDGWAPMPHLPRAERPSAACLAPWLEPPWHEAKL